MSLSKKIRFEVFKRDSFTCQYCGRSAPEVTLQADHIDPVANGGTDEILNLVTSCFDCNQGKKHRLLSDSSVIAKQKSQLDALQERREQIEMMLEWKKELLNLGEQSVEGLADLWAQTVEPYSLNETGKAELRQWLRRFSVEEIADAIVVATGHYLRHEDDKVTHESVNVAFFKIPGICVNRRREKEDPNIAHINYVRAILRNRLNYVSDTRFMPLMHDVIETGIDWAWVKRVAKTASSWTKFYNTIFDEAHKS